MRLLYNIRLAEHIQNVYVTFAFCTKYTASERPFMLTRKQYDLLMFIHERLKETGVPPSFDEMKEALDLRSKSGIHRLITGLEERGFIRRLPHRARALEIVKLPGFRGPWPCFGQPRLQAERDRRLARQGPPPDRYRRHRSASMPPCP